MIDRLVFLKDGAVLTVLSEESSWETLAPMKGDRVRFCEGFTSYKAAAQEFEVTQRDFLFQPSVGHIALVFLDSAGVSRPEPREMFDAPLSVIQMKKSQTGHWEELGIMESHGTAIKEHEIPIVGDKIRVSLDEVSSIESRTIAYGRGFLKIVLYLGKETQALPGLCDYILEK